MSAHLALLADATVVALAIVSLILAFVRLFARERQSRERAEGLARVALALGPHLNVEVLSETLAEEMRRLLHAERASFWMLRDGAIERVHSAGYGPKARELIKSIEGLQLGDRPGMAELASGRPVIVEDPRSEPKLLRDPIRLGLRSYMAVPIVVDDELRGILSCSERTQPRRYSPDDVETAQALAAQASAAMRNALLYERAFEASRSDHLTGLGNRRAFHEQLDTEIARARRHRRNLSVLILDVDYLKQVNDGHGHVAGDEVLARVGTLVDETIRREDGVYRIGGDEFAFVLPETGPEQAAMAAERIRIAVERAHLEVDPECDVTVSIGVSSYPDHGVSADELFERADSALYEVKRGGRNAVCSATSLDPAGPGVRFGIDVHAVVEGDLLIAAYQPIVDLETDEIFAYEAFCRLDPAHAIAPTSTLLRAAAALGLSETLDRRCRAVALTHAPAKAETIFVNVSPSALASAEFDVDDLLSTIRTCGREPGQVVLELTEHERFPAPQLVANLVRCQEAGLRLSLDDFGDRATDLDVVTSLPFDFVKIDARIVRGDDDLKRRLVLGLLVVAREVGARLLAEGVETEAELKLVKDLGFEAAQGYHLQPPAVAPLVRRPA